MHVYMPHNGYWSAGFEVYTTPPKRVGSSAAKKIWAKLKNRWQKNRACWPGGLVLVLYTYT
jgi:hypothetical protein